MTWEWWHLDKWCHSPLVNQLPANWLIRGWLFTTHLRRKKEESPGLSGTEICRVDIHIIILFQSSGDVHKVDDPEEFSYVQVQVEHSCFDSNLLDLKKVWKIPSRIVCAMIRPCMLAVAYSWSTALCRLGPLQNVNVLSMAGPRQVFSSTAAKGGAIALSSRGQLRCDESLIVTGHDAFCDLFSGAICELTYWVM